MGDFSITPYELSILLHAYTTNAPWPDKSAPIYEDTLRKLMSFGLIAYVQNGGGLQETDKLSFYLQEGVLKTPLPVEKWVFDD